MILAGLYEKKTTYIYTSKNITMSKDLHATKCRACLFPLNAATNIVPIFKEYKSTTLLAHMISDIIHIVVCIAKNLFSFVYITMFGHVNEYGIILTGGPERQFGGKCL